MSCAACHKAEKDKIKNQIKIEEQEKHSYFERMQEQVFQRAHTAMQEELKEQEVSKSKISQTENNLNK